MAFRVLRRRESDFSAEARPEPLMHVASKANDALGKLDADLRAGGFGTNSRGLARELYASFTATAVGVKGTEDEAIAWGIGRALAIDLDSAGARRGALALLEGLIAFGASHADPQILARLKATQEAIDPKLAGRRRAAETTPKVPDRPAIGPKPNVQDTPLRPANRDPANRETSSPKPSTLESDSGKAPGKAWRVWRVKPSAPLGKASPQSLLDPAEGASGTGPAAVLDPAETSPPALDRTDESGDTAHRAVAAKPEPVAPALRAESPTPIPETSLTELEEANETRPAVVPGPAETSLPPPDGADEAAEVARSAVAAPPEPAAPTHESESPVPIPETSYTESVEAGEAAPAAVPAPVAASNPPPERTDEAADAARSAVAADPEPAAPALQRESQAPIPETPLIGLGEAGETRPAAAFHPAEFSWPPFDGVDDVVDTAQNAVAADPEPVTPTLEAESPAPILETPRTEIQFDPEPDLGKPTGKQYEEQGSGGEERSRDYLGREEPRLVAAGREQFVETGLRIGPDERLVLASTRPRSRRGSEFLVGAVTALIGVVLYLLASYDGNFLQHPLATLKGFATSLTDPAAPQGNVLSGATVERPAAGPDENVVEKLPMPGAGRLLSSEEVRYCVFQGRRLGYLRNQVRSDASVRRFNGLVTDFNSRCSHFRFENKALQAAFDLAAARQDQLEADAARIMASWPVSEAGVLIDLQTHDGAFAVQARLKTLGYYRQSVDGVWGPMSADALSNFRRQTALGADATWNLATQSALLGR
jgi:putative peptidoglycan binding protein